MKTGLLLAFVLSALCGGHIVWREQHALRRADQALFAGETALALRYYDQLERQSILLSISLHELTQGRRHAAVQAQQNTVASRDAIIALSPPASRD